MANKILTPITLWDKFSDNLPLNETKLFSETINSAVYNCVYFSGRNVGSSRVRIYGIYAEQKNVKANTIVILPDVSGRVDVDLISHFANHGFNVLSVDLAGSRKDATDFTVYPDKISYANFDNSASTFNLVPSTAKETCWYEWCAVARYAVSYAKYKAPNSKIGVLGIKNGANVAWQLTATDSRVNASAFISGAGWIAYKGVYKHSEQDIELNDERYRFIAGIEAHTYAQHVKVPVFFASTTNSDDFDSDRAVDTLQRVDNQNKCWFNFSVTSKEVLESDCFNDIDLFFSKFIDGKRIKIPSVPKIRAELNDEEVVYSVEVSNQEEVEAVTLYYSDNDLNPSERVWFLQSKPILIEDDVYTFKRMLYGKVKFDISYAVVKYKNGFTLSTRFNYLEINVESNSKVPSVIFSSSKMMSTFVVKNVKTKLFGEVFSTDNLYDYVKGPCGIVGVSTKNLLLSYSVKKFADLINHNSFIKLDVFTAVPDTLTIQISSKDGNDYYISLNFDGDDCWNNVTVPFFEFKTDIGMPIKNFEDIYCISVYSLGSILINNFLIL